MSGLDIKRMIRNVKNENLIVTRPINDWLLKHGDDAFSDEVADWVADQLRTQPRVREGSFSGASAGQCKRRQELAFAGAGEVVIDNQLRNIFNDGKWRHLRWQAMLLETGTITHAEYPVFWRDQYSRGTLDARGVVPTTHSKPRWHGLEFGFELKGVSTFQYSNLAKNGPLPKHYKQVHHYFVLGNLDLFSIVYEDKTTQAWVEWVIEPDAKMLIEAEHEINQLAKSVKTKKIHDLLPECHKRTGQEFRDCPFGGKGGVCVQAISKRPPEFSRGVLPL